MRALAAVVPLVLVVAGCTSPLPEEGSTAATLYRERCGGCHRLYAPGALRPAMWEMMVARMAPLLARAGRPLRADERQTILDYLKRNADGAARRTGQAAESTISISSLNSMVEPPRSQSIR